MMLLQCLASIPHLWDKLKHTVTTHNNGFVRPLPEEIIIDILSRLPADCVLECRKVCKQWLALTSTPYFAEMHLKRAGPEILVQCTPETIERRDELDFFIFDEGAKEGEMVKKIRAGSILVGAQDGVVLSGSCNGLLLFKPMFPSFIQFFICNPVTGEQMTISPPVQPAVFCGFFFHTLVKEIKLLVVHRFQYFIYSLGDKKWRKLVAFSYKPTYPVNPVIVNGALHWMAKHDYRSEPEISPCKNSIMIFNMDTEDFCTMPHPGEECDKPEIHKQMQLIERKGGQLCFCCIRARSIDIWVLEDYGNWFWVKKYKVDLNWDLKRNPLTLLNIQNDELLLDWYSRGLFRYHLDQNTVKKIGGRWEKLPRVLLDLCVPTFYIKSFVSLNSSGLG